MKEIKEDGIYIGLTSSVLDINQIINYVRSPKAGAIVLFAGTHSKYLSVSIT